MVDLELENRNKKGGRYAKDAYEKYAHNEIIENNLRFSIGDSSIGSKEESLSPKARSRLPAGMRASTNANVNATRLDMEAEI
jgi:hypothetical protein